MLRYDLCDSVTIFLTRSYWLPKKAEIWHGVHRISPGDYSNLASSLMQTKSKLRFLILLAVDSEPGSHALVIRVCRQATVHLRQKRRIQGKTGLCFRHACAAPALAVRTHTRVKQRKFICLSGAGSHLSR